MTATCGRLSIMMKTNIRPDRLWHKCSEYKRTMCRKLKVSVRNKNWRRKIFKIRHDRCFSPPIWKSEYLKIEWERRSWLINEIFRFQYNQSQPMVVSQQSQLVPYHRHKGLKLILVCMHVYMCNYLFTFKYLLKWNFLYAYLLSKVIFSKEYNF